MIPLIELFYPVLPDNNDTARSVQLELLFALINSILLFKPIPHDPKDVGVFINIGFACLFATAFGIVITSFVLNQWWFSAATAALSLYVHAMLYLEDKEDKTE
jgi:hypothetical protein